MKLGEVIQAVTKDDNLIFQRVDGTVRQVIFNGGGLLFFRHFVNEIEKPEACLEDYGYLSDDDWVEITTEKE